jgi:hypothetical protein
MARRRLGEVLLERGAISQAQLEAALFRQKQTRQKLGVVLVQQGIITEDQLAHTLAEALQLPLVDLRSGTDWAAVHLLRARFCEQHDCFPYSLDRAGKRLLLAMADPLNAAALSEAEFTTGFTVQPCVTSASQVRSAILRAYHKEGQVTPLKPVPPKPEAPIVVGQVLDEPKPPPARPSQPKTLGDELDELMGAAPSGDEAAEKLEKKFWALVRVLSKKGIITREEFHRELQDSDLE